MKSSVVNSSIVQPLGEKTNLFLFELCVKYIEDFDQNKELTNYQVSDYLINSLVKRFDIEDIRQIGIHQDCTEIYVYEHLNYDYYFFDINPIYSLKRTAPKLFNAFCVLIKGLGLTELENSDTSFFCEDTYDFYLECKDITKRKYKGIQKRLEKAKNKISEVGAIAQNRKEILEELNNYKPKNETFFKIKEFLIQWMDFNPFFMYTYPYEYFELFDKSLSDEKNQENWHEESYEITEIYQRIHYYINQCDFFTETIKDSENCKYANTTFPSPCWKISLEENQQEIRKNLYDFEKFSKEFMEIIDLIIE